MAEGRGRAVVLKGPAMSRVASVVAVTAAVLLLPGTAGAQLSMKPLTGLGTVHVGVTSGGNVGTSASAGGSVAVVEENGLGAEIDFGFGAGADSQLGPSGSVQSYMVNFIGVRPVGRIRPFVTVGGGALRVNNGCAVDCARTLSWTDWGWNGGAGAFVVMNDWLALRGDVRYLGALANHPDPDRPRGFDYWRVSVGATFVWAVAN